MSQILVVDDSTVTRTCVARLLEQQGHSVTAAANGKEAWITLYANLPDLVVLDLMMPQMDGLTFLRMLRNSHHWNHIPVLVLTGVEEDGLLLSEAKTLGVSDVILKGDDSLEQLQSRVHDLLPQYRPAARTTKRAARRSAATHMAGAA